MDATPDFVGSWISDCAIAVPFADYDEPQFPLLPYYPVSASGVRGDVEYKLQRQCRSHVKDEDGRPVWSACLGNQVAVPSPYPRKLYHADSRGRMWEKKTSSCLS